MLYTVRFATIIEGLNTNAWAPAKGDDYEVGKREAERRMRTLVENAKTETPVDGVVPWLVEVVDENGVVMYSATPTEPEDEPVGKWAKKAA